eukprot:CAMPEP_0197941212 /NCGR_PEP_ID=MMETSP1439-20131203/122436_1 /TAXON_ID=66791 /ORGANISM="Gonyaulax spinifera, Strain CCMP409" /LENGTH=299 /DNA_ID=CAMNT_0043564401 /DNA_START=25 /DNA_END=920 /DNA_ORIENTATION=+
MTALGVGVAETGSCLAPETGAGFRSARLRNEDPPPFVLLEASPPSSVSGADGLYRAHLRRASLHQPFGVVLHATESGARLSSIAVAEDLRHLGLRKSDELVALNGAKPRSVGECRKVLKHAFSVELTLKRRGSASPTGCPGCGQRTGCTDGCALAGGGSFTGCGEHDPPNEQSIRPLLTMARPDMSGLRDGEVRLVLQRASVFQSFGIEFTYAVERADSGECELTARVVEDLPHLGLRSGNRLVSINGMQPRSSAQCQRICERALTMSIVVRRRYQGHARAAKKAEPIVEELRHGAAAG